LDGDTTVSNAAPDEMEQYKKKRYLLVPESDDLVKFELNLPNHTKQFCHCQCKS
jgi:hypothetical protein